MLGSSASATAATEALSASSGAGAGFSPPMTGTFTQSTTGTGTLSVASPSHPIFDGVAAVRCSNNCLRYAQPSLTAGAVSLGTWANGEPAVILTVQRNPNAKIDMNMSKYVDESTLDELEKEGFFKKLSGK